MGLMQIMPLTWSELRARYDLGVDPYDPRDNILAGAAYIREFYQRFAAPASLPRTMRGRHATRAIWRPVVRCQMRPRDYVAILAPMIGGKQVNGKIVAVAESLTMARSPLFVVRSARSSSDNRPGPGARPDRSSNVRPVVDLSALVPQSGNLLCTMPVRRDRMIFIAICRCYRVF
jgi:hypothetical protein